MSNLRNEGREKDQLGRSPMSNLRNEGREKDQLGRRR